MHYQLDAYKMYIYVPDPIKKITVNIPCCGYYCNSNIPQCYTIPSSTFYRTVFISLSLFLRSSWNHNVCVCELCHRVAMG